MKLPREMTCIFLPAVGHASIARNQRTAIILFSLTLSSTFQEFVVSYFAKKQPCQSHPVTVISEGEIFVKYCELAL